MSGVDNKKIKAEIQRVSSVRYVSAKLFFACTSSLYDRLTGKTDWKIEELKALSRICGWTKEQFLNIIGFDKED